MDIYILLLDKNKNKENIDTIDFQLFTFFFKSSSHPVDCVDRQSETVQQQQQQLIIAAFNEQIQGRVVNDAM